MNKRERHNESCRRWNSKNPTYCTDLRKRKRANMTPNELIQDRERMKLQSRNARARRLDFKNYDEYLIHKENKLQATKIKHINRQIKSAHLLEERRINKENHRVIQNEKMRIKRLTDMNYKIMDNLRARTRKILRIQSVRKYTAMAKLIGLSGKELNKYLFPDGKPDYEFHIDHILPLSKFNLKNKDHQLVSLYYKNLQILPSFDNMSKRDILPEDWKKKIFDICKDRNINPDKIIKYIEKVAA